METVNGFEIIARVDFDAKPATRAGRVILVDRGGDSFQRYVTAKQYRTGEFDKEWAHGHYFSDKNAAFDDFVSRARQEFEPLAVKL